jgi:hypothetical protein
MNLFDALWMLFFCFVASPLPRSRTNVGALCGVSAFIAGIVLPAALTQVPFVIGWLVERSRARRAKGAPMKVVADEQGMIETAMREG